MVYSGPLQVWRSFSLMVLDLVLLSLSRPEEEVQTAAVHHVEERPTLSPAAATSAPVSNVHGDTADGGETVSRESVLSGIHFFDLMAQIRRRSVGCAVSRKHSLLARACCASLVRQLPPQIAASTAGTPLRHGGKRWSLLSTVHRPTYFRPKRRSPPLFLLLTDGRVRGIASRASPGAGGSERGPVEGEAGRDLGSV